jgi:hypothetical protein
MLSGVLVGAALFAFAVGAGLVLFLPAMLLPLLAAAFVSSIFAYIALTIDRHRLAWLLLLLVALPSLVVAGLVFYRQWLYP